MSPRPDPTRRLVLRGLGCSLALPWLESVSADEGQPAGKATAQRRFAAVFMPNGTPTESWWAKDGKDGKDGKNGLELSPTLQPLLTHDVASHCVVPINFMHKTAINGPGGHQPKMNFLSGERVKRSTTAIQVGTTIDQVMARALGKQTALPYLAMGAQGITNGGEFGFSGLYSSHISWSNATRPAPRHVQPAKVFDALFGQDNSGKRKRQLLDDVSEQTKQLQRTLSGDDKRRLDEFMTSVRELEQRIEHTEAQKIANPPPAPPIDRPDDKIVAVDKQQALLMDLLVLAFQTDRTRIATYMLGNDVSRLNYKFLKGAAGTHHEFSHSGRTAPGRKSYQIISQYMVDLVARAAARMATIQEGEHTLLDNSIILFGSSLSEGGVHDPANLPLLLIGGGGGWKTGRTIGTAGKKHSGNFCSLHLSIMQAMGVKLKTWGDANAPCAELA